MSVVVCPFPALFPLLPSSVGGVVGFSPLLPSPVGGVGFSPLLPSPVGGGVGFSPLLPSPVGGVVGFSPPVSLSSFFFVISIAYLANSFSDGPTYDIFPSFFIYFCAFGEESNVVFNLSATIGLNVQFYLLLDQ